MINSRSDQSTQAATTDNLTKILPLNYAVGDMQDAMDAYQNCIECIKENKLIEAEIQLHKAKQSYNLSMQKYHDALQKNNDINTIEKSPEKEFADFKGVADGMLSYLNAVKTRIYNLSQAAKPLRRASSIAISSLSPIAEKPDSIPPASIPTSKISDISSKISFFERRLSMPALSGAIPSITKSRPIPPPLPTSPKPQLIVSETTSVDTPTSPIRSAPPPLPRAYSVGTRRFSLDVNSQQYAPEVSHADNSDEKGRFTRK